MNVASRKWSELSRSQKTVVSAVAAVEVALTLAAWRDLASRPAEGVRGSKKYWALAALVQPVGPLAYFAVGRR